MAGTFVIGVGAAWLVAMYDFPGRRIFNWALMLPLSMPTYVLAFVFVGIFDFSGPVQALLRTAYSTPLIWFPEIRSTGGVVLVMTLALYPYVYLLARSAFTTQGKRAMEVCQILGCNRSEAFFRAALPMARPWIAGGMMLVLMETLADFGAVSVFNYNTFTTAIYKAWFGFFSISAAAQLSSVLLVAVLLVVWIEQRFRSRMRFGQVGRMTEAASHIRLAGFKKWAAFASLAFIVFIAFLLPGAQLMYWAAASAALELNTAYLGLVSRSVFLSLSAAAVISALGLILAYIQRHSGDLPTTWAIRVSTLGYALPGTVLAVGVAVMIGFLDRGLIRMGEDFFGLNIGTLFQGSVLTVIFAYAVRFLTIGFNGIGSAMNRISKSLDEASQLLGVVGWRLIGKVHIPILKNGIFTAAILVFVDVMKEMPITLMTRPFGWDTLAVKIFELTSEGEWQRAALPSLALVAAGFIPLLLLYSRSEKAAL
jgi:iron(III) transport system permease protein